MKQHESQKKCPLKSVHKRMDETHHLWHETLSSYPFPERFCLNLNNCIQTLRNVTFHLQKQKDTIKNFEAWYPQWRERLAKDKIMKWLVRARNIIVKEGDLATKSFCRVSILSSYHEPPYFEYEVSPSKKPDDIRAEGQRVRLPEHILKNGTLRIERRWVVKDLPKYELLEVLAHGYGVLSELVDDCHRHMGLHEAEVRTMAEDGHAEPYEMPVEHLKGRLPCMVMAEDARTLLIRISTGEVVSFSERSIPSDKKFIEKVVKRYKFAPLSENLDVKTEAKELLERAKRILSVDGHHNLIAFLHMPNGKKSVVGLTFEDRGDKYVAWRRLALQVEKLGAIAVTVIAESWLSEYDSKKPHMFPEDSPKRKEALSVQTVSRDGENFMLACFFERRGREIVFGEVREMEDARAGYLLPVFKVWAHK